MGSLHDITGGLSPEMMSAAERVRQQIADIRTAGIEPTEDAIDRLYEMEALRLRARGVELPGTFGQR